jgi:hypothetical protein
MIMAISSYGPGKIQNIYLIQDLMNIGNSAKVTMGHEQWGELSSVGAVF